MSDDGVAMRPAHVFWCWLFAVVAVFALWVWCTP